MTSKWGKWAGPVESGILDLAAAVMIIRLIRRRNDMDSLGSIDGGAGNMPPGKWRKTGIAVDLIRRLVGSQAFFFLALACFDRQSWIHSGVRSIWGSVFHRPQLSEISNRVSLR